MLLTQCYVVLTQCHVVLTQCHAVLTQCQLILVLTSMGLGPVTTPLTKRQSTCSSIPVLLGIVAAPITIPSVVPIKCVSTSTSTVTQTSSVSVIEKVRA